MTQHKSDNAPGSVPSSLILHTSNEGTVDALYSKFAKPFVAIFSINVMFVVIPAITLVASIIIVSLVSQTLFMDELSNNAAIIRNVISTNTKTSIINFFAGTDNLLSLSSAIISATLIGTTRKKVQVRLHERQLLKSQLQALVQNNIHAFAAGLTFNSGELYWYEQHSAHAKAPQYFYEISPFTNYTLKISTWKTNDTVVERNILYDKFLHNHIKELSTLDIKAGEIILGEVTAHPTLKEMIVPISKKVFDETNGIITIIYSLRSLEHLLVSLQTEGSKIVVTDDKGNYVASTFDHAYSSYNTYVTTGESTYMNDMRHEELSALDDSIRLQSRLNTSGSWGNSKDIPYDFKYDSPNTGSILVRRHTLSFANRNWNVFTLWPEELWIHRLQVNTKLNNISVFGTIIIGVFITLLFTVPIAKSLLKIKCGFNNIRQMGLEAPITKQADAKFLWYEMEEFQRSFATMLTMLKSFAKYVPKNVVDQLVHDNSEAQLGLTPSMCTIFFLDIKDFTKLSEELEPSKLVQLMSDAFEVLSAQVHSNGGIIDKYIGDCIMAFWSGPDQETKSVRCALECQKQLALLSEKWKREGLPLVQCRIGINTGNVLLGNFGSSRRFNFTIIGDNVNCASRIESLNKIYGTNIMIGESTYEKLDRDLKRLCRRAERVKVKGKSKELLVYAVQGAHTDPSYDKAFELYVNGNFEKANELFGDLEQDPLVKYKILQCDKYKMGTKVPWNGVVTLQDK